MPETEKLTKEQIIELVNSFTRIKNLSTNINRNIYRCDIVAYIGGVDGGIDKSIALNLLKRINIIDSAYSEKDYCGYHQDDTDKIVSLGCPATTCSVCKHKKVKIVLSFIGVGK